MQNSETYYHKCTVRRSSSKGPVILVRLRSNVNFLDIFSNNTEISNCMKIRPLGAELLHADGQTRRSRQPLFTMLRKTPQNMFRLQFYFASGVGYVAFIDRTVSESITYFFGEQKLENGERDS